MFENQRFGWLLGRPSLSGGIVGWTGIAVSPNSFTIIKSGVDLAATFEREFDDIHALGCTASENLVAAVESSIARKIAPKIVDISLAMRIASTGASKEISHTKTIDLLTECMSANIRKPISKLEAVLLLEGRVDGPRSPQDVDSHLRFLLEVIARKLRKSGELRRYISYELPAHRVLLAQSRFRLLTDKEAVATIASELSTEQRAARVELLTKHALDPTDFLASFEARRMFTERHLGISRDRLTLGEFRDLLDEVTIPDEGTKLIADFLRKEANRRSMSSLSATSEEGCQVLYDPIGTTTGRVIMKSPGVQWLGKIYRKHILPPPGYELRYLDYSCFEPTILAALSGDPEFSTACSSDIYNRVGEWLDLDGPDSRDLAKTILLRFIYGQSRDKLAATLSAAKLLDTADALSRIDSLGQRLTGVFQFRSEITAQALRTGYMETRVGNRCRVDELESYKALSHYLQGTGALIFKLALIGVFSEESAARLVVPMHDAFLCAFPKKALDESCMQAVEIMRSAFLRVTGADLAKVTVREEF